MCLDNFNTSSNKEFEVSERANGLPLDGSGIPFLFTNSTEIITLLV